jgi:hypothetical protein
VYIFVKISCNLSFSKRGIPAGTGKGLNWRATVTDSRRFPYGVEISEIGRMVPARPIGSLEFDPEERQQRANIQLVTASD